MPEVVEPGTRLVERYRLEQRLDGVSAPHDAAGTEPDDVTAHLRTADPDATVAMPLVPDGASTTAPATEPAEGTTFWRAEDELLARPVSVCLIDTRQVSPDAVLAAARQAAALPDSRFLRVLDAARIDGHVYVVSEWVPATNLVGLLADGPLPAGEARALAGEVAEAMAGAHDAGLAHLCLGPEHVLRTAHGQLKLSGLAVEAAARGLGTTDHAAAVAADVHGVGAVLYAALTGRWPGDEVTPLPPAPRADEAACHPRQVRAGVPPDLDEITCRALGLPGHRKAVVSDAHELAQALGAAGGTGRLPVVGREQQPGAAFSAPPPPGAGNGSGDPGRPDRPGDADPETAGPPRRSRAVIAAWVLAALVLVSGLVLFGGQMVMTALDGGDPGTAADEGTGDDESAASPDAPRVRALDIAAVRSFDPDGDGEEHQSEAGLVADGDPATSWSTMTYFDPLELQKSGVGLVLDLGAAAEVSEVEIRIDGGATGLEVRLANRSGASADAYQPFDEAANASGNTRLRVSEPVRGRYVLVWLTRLPPENGSYVGRISEVTVRGTAARG